MSKKVHYFAVFSAVCTFGVLFAGAMVTSTGSGLSVPDWPLSYGQFFPPMIGGIFYEHGHRLMAGTVACLTAVLAFLIWRTGQRPAVRWLGSAACLIVVAQAVLGGLTVLLRLPTEVSVAHACLGQSFFCVMVLLAALTSPAWTAPTRPLAEEPVRWLSLPTFSLVTSIGFFGQLLLGAIMRHQGAGLAIPDFPTVFGGFFPPEFTPAITIHFAHRLGAYTMATLAVVLCTRVMRGQPDQLGLVGLSGGLLALISIQVMLGASIIWLKRPVVITSLHLAVGALCLATSVLLTVRVFYLSATKPAWSPLDLTPLRNSLELG
jgi:cytochrome c oxidase assembly protein subunit 15